MKKNKITLSGILYWIFLTLLAIWPALYNQFPLVTPDSGAYIGNGMASTLSIDRPPGYGLYLLLTSWRISLWVPILVQGALFAWLIHELCTKVLADKINRFGIAMIVLLVTFGTSAAWFNSQLMADAFSGPLLIAILLLFLGTGSKLKNTLLTLLVFFCFMVHSSHVVITLIMSAFLFFYFRRKQLHAFAKTARKLFLLSVAGILLTCTIYAIGGYGFRFSPVSHMFLISRMAEDGILDEYLKEHCPVENLSLCASQGNTGDRQWMFMWVGKYPHSAENGWIKTRKEYNKVIYGSLRSPKYLGLHVVKNTEAGLRQLGQVYVGDGMERNAPGSSPYDNIERYFRHEIKEFRSSVQNVGQLPLPSANLIIVTFSVLAGIVTFYFWGRRHQHQEAVQDMWPVIFGITILFIVLNAFVTATFSTVIARLQARVFWVLPFICVLYIYDRGVSIYKKTTSDEV